MKLKRLTGIALTAILAITLAVSGCEKDDNDGKPDDKEDLGPRPNITLRPVPTGSLLWVSSNVSRPANSEIRLGFKVDYDKPLTNVKCVRRVTDGPGSGTESVIIDSSFNASDNVLLFPSANFYEFNSVSGMAQQLVVFTFTATANDGTKATLSIEVRPAIQLGSRENQKVYDSNTDGAYDLVTAVNLNKDQAPARQDIKIAKTAASFKLTTGNGSKFKHYNGSAFFEGFQTDYDLIQTAWTQSGAELNETKDVVEDASYKFILVKSSQNDKIYAINVSEYNADHIIFDLVGQGI